MKNVRLFIPETARALAQNGVGSFHRAGSSLEVSCKTAVFLQMQPPWGMGVPGSLISLFFRHAFPLLTRGFASDRSLYAIVRAFPIRRDTL